MAWTSNTTYATTRDVTLAIIIIRYPLTQMFVGVQIPDAETVEEMKDQQSFKQRNLETAMKTQQSLEAEKRRREEEIRKINELKPRMVKELDTLNERIAFMQQEMAAFEDIAGLRKNAERTTNVRVLPISLVAVIVTPRGHRPRADKDVVLLSDSSSWMPSARTFAVEIRPANRCTRSRQSTRRW